jgi:hypothetical protein
MYEEELSNLKELVYQEMRDYDFWKNMEKIDHLIGRLKEELEESSLYAELFFPIILLNDTQKLKKKTQNDIKNLKQIYFGTSITKKLISIKKRKKLKRMILFFKNLEVVTGTAEEREEFLAPIFTGNIYSLFPDDFFCLSPKYVYTSLNHLCFLHQMTQERNILSLLEFDKSKAQIVFVDMVEMNSLSYNKDPELSHYLHYLYNVFDYELGLEVLALYCAIVFDSMEEMKEFFKVFCGNRPMLQDWRNRKFDNFKFKSGKGIEEAYSAMLKISNELSIEPPLNLEVRILHSAKTKRRIAREEIPF